MTANRRFALVLTGVVILAVVGGVRSAMNREREEPTGFLAAVDLTPLDNMAVHTEGRIKSFASHANALMDFVSGPAHYQGQTPVMTYLDLMFRPERYVEADVIYVKNKPLRAEIIDALEGRRIRDQDPAEFTERMRVFLEKGLISEQLLSEPKVVARLQRLGSDLIRWGKFVQAVDGALGWKDSGVLSGNLAVVPPVPATNERWSHVLDLERPSALTESVPDPAAPGEQLAGLPDDLEETIVTSWKALRAAWRAEQPQAVTEAAATFAAGLAQVNPDVYPETSRLELESFYFRSYNLTWIWMVYLLACIPLLLTVVYRWTGAQRLAVVMFLVAFGLHSWALGLRWYVSGRWPNSNMFEAVTTAAWFGGVAALCLLPWAKGVLGSVLLLTSAVASMVALMCAYYLPIQLNPNINNMMPVLHDVWLYIHTNVIIWSYVLIFMAAVAAALYLVWRACGGASTFARVGGSEALAMSTADPDAGKIDTAEGEGGGAATAASGGGSMGAVLDGVTVDLMKLSFVMLWAGLVMGAIWADHSWGRPWGWDPKEVFALNTFLVFTVLVHGRIKSRDKGLWTAWLAVVGAGVMLFNWVIINFVITGLHSYA
jgi:cytochrome c-type biogenesis protein CcsB